jgi:hypothetical protein
MNLFYYSRACWAHSEGIPSRRVSSELAISTTKEAAFSAFFLPRRHERLCMVQATPPSGDRDFVPGNALPKPEAKEAREARGSPDQILNAQYGP